MWDNIHKGDLQNNLQKAAGFCAALYYLGKNL